MENVAYRFDFRTIKLVQIYKITHHTTIDSIDSMASNAVFSYSQPFIVRYNT
jgi:hypothetical protein